MTHAPSPFPYDPAPEPSPPPAPSPAPPAKPKPAGSTVWEEYPMRWDRALTDCTAAFYVRFDARYQKWVGVMPCNPTRYKIMLGETKDGMFHEIGDFAGGGEDHCELVSPSFSLPNEDDITSGGCTSCRSQMTWERPGEVPVYSRSMFGDAFELRSWPEHNLYTSRWYECGVSIP